LFIENYSKQLIEKYPNFESNEIAKNAITDSITNFWGSGVVPWMD